MYFHRPPSHHHAAVATYTPNIGIACILASPRLALPPQPTPPCMQYPGQPPTPPTVSIWAAAAAARRRGCINAAPHKAELTATYCPSKPAGIKQVHPQPVPKAAGVDQQRNGCGWEDSAQRWGLHVGVVSERRRRRLVSGLDVKDCGLDGRSGIDGRIVSCGTGYVRGRAIHGMTRR